MMRAVVHAAAAVRRLPDRAGARGVMQETSFHRPASGHARAGIEVMP